MVGGEGAVGLGERRQGLGQVFNPVVPAVAVEVAQRRGGPGAMDHEPRDIMGTKVFMANPDLINARGALAQVDLATKVQVRFPMQLPCFGAVAETVADQAKIVSAHVVPF